MKTIRILLLCIAIISLLFLPAVSHSGRTDSKGGHRNSATGEYHYHHGHSAHQHTDLDGDGVKDCPYDFDDKTDHSSGNKSSSKSSSQTPKSYTNQFSNTPAVTKSQVTTSTSDALVQSSQSIRPSGSSNEAQAAAVACTCIAGFVGACYLASKNK